MKEPTKIYTYTAQRGVYITSVCTLSFLFLTDIGLLLILILLFIHNDVLKFVLLGGVASLYGLLIAILLAPLWTAHRLTENYLYLHYGLALNVRIPRTAIISAQPVRERLTMLEPLLVRNDAAKSRVVAALADQGQVVLHLNKPHPLKVGRSTVLTDTLLINVDARDEFLADLSTQVMLNISDSTNIAPPAQESLLQRMPLFTRISKETPSSVEGTLVVPTKAIEIEGLTHKFGKLTAVDHVDMAIRQGEIYGFLGSNGAGKTTIMKMLVGLLQPGAGRAWIMGHDVWAEPLAVKAALGYVADRSVLYERLTGREFLEFLGQIRGMPLKETGQRIESLLELLELTEQSDRLCGAYSFGMKRKLSLAGALLHSPQVLILDEPLNGLDPRSARSLKDLFGELAISGTTILLSTHDLATAEAVCHRIGILHRGRLLAEGSVAELRQGAAASDLESVFLGLTAEQPVKGVRI